MQGFGGTGSPAAVVVDVVRRAVSSGGGGSFTDPENARTIHLAAGLLVAIALALAAGTVWWWRSSKSEHPALGPLETMGTRRWVRADYTEQRRRLDDARPAGAEPATAGHGEDAEAVDLQAAAQEGSPSYDDMLDISLTTPAERHAALQEEAAAAADAIVLAEVASAGHTDEPTRHDGIPEPDLSPSSGMPIDPLLRAQSAE